MRAADLVVVVGTAEVTPPDGVALEVWNTDEPSERGIDGIERMRLIRDDITANLDAIDDLVEANPPLDLILVESGGDNLTATFSTGLIDVQIFVIDVAGGDKVPRKGGPGVTFSDLLVINKIDLAEMVGADLDRMRHDCSVARPSKPTLFTDLRHQVGVVEVADEIVKGAMLPTPPRA